MRRKFVILFLSLVCGTASIAQQLDLPLVQNHTSVPLASITKSVVNPLESIALPTNSTLREQYTVTSLKGTHTYYQQYIGDRPILFCGAKVHTKNTGSVFIQNFVTHKEVITQDAAYLVPTNEGLLSVDMRINKDANYPTKTYYLPNGKILITKDIKKYNKKDTSIFAKVFMINPINSADTIYSGDFTDNNDATNAALDAQLQWQKMPARYSNDTFFFESEFLKIEDLGAPAFSYNYALNDSLSFNRMEDEFEVVNVFYHINKMGQYVNHLGYDSLTKQLRVDVHALGGIDNSAYTPDGHTLEFGDGGVDDAEDGEVVIHEFTHSLSEIASPDNTIGKQREAMEEGSCDYFAKAYSRSINDNTRTHIFSWDGHNEYWNGFAIETNRKFPVDLKKSKDGDRDIWSSALMCGHNSIGRKAMDSLFLEHLFYQIPGGTMPEMAQIILDIDQEDFNSRYYAPLKKCFVDAGFLTEDPQANQDTLFFQVQNQAGFVHGQGALTIQWPTMGTLTIYNSLGQVVAQKQSTNWVSLNPQDYVKGMYVISLDTGDKLYSYKILR